VIFANLRNVSGAMKKVKKISWAAHSYVGIVNIMKMNWQHVAPLDLLTLTRAQITKIEVEINASKLIRITTDQRSRNSSEQSQTNDHDD